MNLNVHDTDQYHTSYMRARTHTHTLTDYDCSRNWVLILDGVKILWEEEGFQFGFKGWRGWTVSKVLWEWIPNVGSKAREGVKAMNIFVICSDLSRQITCFSMMFEFIAEQPILIYIYNYIIYVDMFYLPLQKIIKKSLVPVPYGQTSLRRVPLWWNCIWF